MRYWYVTLALLFFSGCLLDPFTSFEEIETIPDPVSVERQVFSLKDFSELRAFDEEVISPEGVVSGFTVAEDEVNGNTYLSAKGEGSIILPEVDLSTLDSLTFSCWMRTFSNNSEKLLTQSVNNFDTARISVINDRVAVGVNGINDSGQLGEALFNGDWVMLTVTIGNINTDAPSSGALIYLDGELVTSSSASWLRFEPGLSLKLLDDFTGDFDDVKVYDVKLDAEAVRNLYRQTSSTYLNENSIEVVPGGLASYYRFDEGNGGIDDISGTNGSFSGDPVFGPDVTSAMGRSLEFPGGLNGPLLEIPCSLFDNVNGFSLSFWAKTSTDAYNPMLIQGPNLFAGTHLVSFNNRELFCGNTLYCFNCGVDDGYVDGEWHHFVITASSINTLVENIPMNLYVDGELSGMSPNSEINFLRNFDLVIGGDGSGTSFEGSLDNLRLYNRPISAQEVTEIFNSGS